MVYWRTNGVLSWTEVWEICKYSGFEYMNQCIPTTLWQYLCTNDEYCCSVYGRDITGFFDKVILITYPQRVWPHWKEASEHDPTS